MYVNTFFLLIKIQMNSYMEKQFNDIISSKRGRLTSHTLKIYYTFGNILKQRNLIVIIVDCRNIWNCFMRQSSQDCSCKQVQETDRARSSSLSLDLLLDTGHCIHVHIYKHDITYLTTKSALKITCSVFKLVKLQTEISKNVQ